MIRTALSLLLIVFALSAFGQQTITVAPGVPDGEPCEPKSPQAVPCSPMAAMKLAGPGTRFELLGGVYGCLDVAGLHGTYELPIVFAPAAGAAVTFSCADSSAAATVSVRDSSNLTFYGFGIVNAAGRPFVTVTNSPAVSFEECSYGDGAGWAVVGKP